MAILPIHKAMGKSYEDESLLYRYKYGMLAVLLPTVVRTYQTFEHDITYFMQKCTSTYVRILYRRSRTHLLVMPLKVAGVCNNVSFKDQQTFCTVCTSPACTANTSIRSTTVSTIKASLGTLCYKQQDIAT